MGTRITDMSVYPIKRIAGQLYYVDGEGYVCAAPLKNYKPK